MLVIDNTACARFREVWAFAKANGLRRQLLDTLRYLSTYANSPGCTYDRQLGKNTRCTLYPDFAPHSFTLVMDRFDGEVWTRFFHGGLIYQGPNLPANGSFPSLTVSLDPGVGWFVHT